MENKKEIYRIKDFRILEIQTNDYALDDLKGDCFCPVVNSDIDRETLRSQELDFEKQVYEEGVFGYVLERWQPEVGRGWEHMDSCWGFVGAYGQGNQHYIVDEMRETILKELGNGK